MAVGSVSVEIVGDSAGVNLLVDRLSLLLGPAGMSAFLGGPVLTYVRQRARNRFANEGDDVSGPWMALAPTTVYVRLALGFPGRHPINRRTGELERWVTGSAPAITVSPVLAGLTYPGNPPTGSLREKVTTAQTGRRSKGTGTSARPVLGLSGTDYIAILGLLATSVEAVGVTGRI